MTPVGSIRCVYCGVEAPDVRIGPCTGGYPLCQWCWFSTPPASDGPAPPTPKTGGKRKPKDKR